MSKPCENCGSDFRVCISCDLYNGKYIEIPDNATNGDMITEILKSSYDMHSTRYIGLAQEDTIYIEVGSNWWNAPYQKGGK